MARGRCSVKLRRPRQTRPLAYGRESRAADASIAWLIAAVESSAHGTKAQAQATGRAPRRLWRMEGACRGAAGTQGAFARRPAGARLAQRLHLGRDTGAGGRPGRGGPGPQHPDHLRAAEEASMKSPKPIFGERLGGEPRTSWSTSSNARRAVAGSTRLQAPAASPLRVARATQAITTSASVYSRVCV